MLRLRAGPQDLPVSWPLTALFLFIYFGMGIATREHLGEANAFPRMLVYVLANVLALGLLLKFRSHLERMSQTLLALFGAGIVIGMVFFVLQLMNDPAQPTQPFMALLFFGVLGWSVAVDANIYRHALDMNMSGGVLVVVALFALSYILEYLLFFQPQP